MNNQTDARTPREKTRVEQAVEELQGVNDHILGINNRLATVGERLVGAITENPMVGTGPDFTGDVNHLFYMLQTTRESLGVLEGSLSRLEDL